MQVEHRMPCAWADVVHGAVTVLDAALAADLGSNEVAISDDLGIPWLGFFQADQMLLGDDEHVRGRLRIDVLENVDLVIFVYLLRRDLARNDLAKQAVRIHESVCPKASADHGNSCTWGLASSGQPSFDRALTPIGLLPDDNGWICEADVHRCFGVSRRRLTRLRQHVLLFPTLKGEAECLCLRWWKSKTSLSRRVNPPVHASWSYSEQPGT